MFGFLTVTDVKVAVLCVVTSCCVLDICRLLEEVFASVIRVVDEESRFLRDICAYQNARHVLDDSSVRLT